MEKWNKYWGFAGERAVKTVAQTALAMITAAGALSLFAGIVNSLVNDICGGIVKSVSGKNKAFAKVPPFGLKAAFARVNEFIFMIRLLSNKILNCDKQRPGTLVTKAVCVVIAPVAITSSMREKAMY